MPLQWRVAARSDPGLVREINEDSGYAAATVIAVADGMGGHAAGEVASEAAIDALVEQVADQAGPHGLDVLAEAIRGANARIRQLVTDDAERAGMGTTLTALMWSEGSLALAHIGDSRAYRLRDGEMVQLTHDHTFVQSLIDEGRISRSEASTHPAKSLILRAVQGENTVQPDLELIDAEPGDRFLLCSDGLDNAGVPDEVIAGILADGDDLDRIVEALVAVGLEGGAPDNVTVVVAEVTGTPGPTGPEPGATTDATSGAAAPAPAGADSTDSADEDAPAGTGRDPRTDASTGADTAVPPAGPGIRVGAAAPAAAAQGSAPPDADSDQPTPRRALLGGHRSSRRQPDPEEDPEALRYAPRAPRRFRWVRRGAVLLVAAGLVWGGWTVASDWVDDQYYVGESAGEVAVFRGLSQSVGPLSLSELDHVAEGLPVDALPALYRSQVQGAIAAEDPEDATMIVDGLRDEACRAAPPEPEPAATPTDAATDPAEPTAAPGAPADPTDPAEEPAAPGAVDAPEQSPADPGATSSFPGLVCPTGPAS